MKKKGSRGRKTACLLGHTHDSKAESIHCDLLHARQARGEISDLKHHHQFYFVVNGVALRHDNNGRVGWKVDFIYKEKGKWVAAESKTGLISRDYPLRKAIFKALHPDWIVVEFKKTGQI